MALQHLRSSTTNKRPDPTAMADGQLAINTPAVSPGLFFKDTAGALVKVGPVHVGTTAPNASPASGGTAGNSVGEQWLDTTGGAYVFKVWDGSAWRSESGTFVDVNGDVMTGTLGIIAGSAGSPGLYFSGDANTGLYSPGSDQLALSTGGTGRLFVDASGRVGMGTASPNALLDVRNATAWVGDGTTDAFLQFNQSATAANRWHTGTGTDNAFIVYSGTYGSGVERARIDSSGRLLVGTSSATAGVVDTASITGSTLNQSTGLRTLSSGGTLDLDLLGTGIVGHLYVTSAQTANAALRTNTIFFITTRQGNATTITALNSADGSSGGRSFTITNPSANIFRFTDTSGSACTVSMSFVGGIGF